MKKWLMINDTSENKSEFRLFPFALIRRAVIKSLNLVCYSGVIS